MIVRGGPQNHDPRGVDIGPGYGRAPNSRHRSTPAVPAWDGIAPHIEAMNEMRHGDPARHWAVSGANRIKRQPDLGAELAAEAAISEPGSRFDGSR